MPEVNYSGQYRRLLEGHFRREFIGINTYTGHPFQVSELVERIAGVVTHV